jgi:hypothetical protein
MAIAEGSEQPPQPLFDDNSKVKGTRKFVPFLLF